MPDLKADPAAPQVISWEPPDGAPAAAAGEVVLHSAAAGPHAEQPLSDSDGPELPADTAEAQCDNCFIPNLQPSLTRWPTRCLQS